MIKPEDVKHLPDDENTPEKRAEKIWAFFGKKDDGELLCLCYLCLYSACCLLETPAGFPLLSHKCQGRTGECFLSPDYLNCLQSHG